MTHLTAPLNLLTAISRLFTKPQPNCTGNALRYSLCNQRAAQRLQARHSLRHLPDHLLRDIGL